MKEEAPKKAKKGDDEDDDDEDDDDEDLKDFSRKTQFNDFFDVLFNFIDSFRQVEGLVPEALEKVGKRDVPFYFLIFLDDLRVKMSELFESSITRLENELSKAVGPENWTLEGTTLKPFEGIIDPSVTKNKWKKFYKLLAADENDLQREHDIKIIPRYVSKTSEAKPNPGWTGSLPGAA